MNSKRYTLLTVTTSLLEQALLALVVLWLLPMAAIDIPLWGLVLMMLALGAYNYMSYRLGRKALARKPIVWPDVGSKGRTTTLISPKGYVRVNGELWQASSSSTIHAGQEIIVVGVEGMTLVIDPAEKRWSGLQS